MNLTAAVRFSAIRNRVLSRRAVSGCWPIAGRHSLARHRHEQGGLHDNPSLRLQNLGDRDLALNIAEFALA